MKNVILPGSSWRRALTIASAFVLSSPAALLAQHYQESILVANVAGQGTTNLDANLVNPWGLARGTDTFWWASDNVTGVSTLYDGSGVKQKLTVMIPHAPGTTVGSPTGIVFNGSSDFALTPNNPALFIFVSLDGTISGWNPNVSVSPATQVVAGSADSVLTGATIAQIGTKRFLYVADLKKGEITVYGTDFKPVELSEKAFHEDHVPPGFAPFNVQNIAGDLYVAYAKQNKTKTFVEIPFHPGSGFVDVFSPEGRFLMRLEHGDWFNAPWGLTLAPSDFGAFSHQILVGQFGSGEILAFDPVTGEFQGKLKDSSDAVISVGGPGALWALAVGIEAPNLVTTPPANQTANMLFFTAGPNFPNVGLFGTLTPVSTDLTQGSGQ